MLNLINFRESWLYKMTNFLINVFKQIQVFSKGIKITPQIYIRKFEEQMAWMSEINPSKAPTLKPYVLQISICEFGINF